MFSGVFRRYSKGKKTKLIIAVLIGLLVVYVVGALMFSVGAVFYGISAPLFQAGVGWFYFALEGILVFALCFIGGVFMVQAQIFSARDNELLLAMPIKPSAILGGRLSALMIIEYIFEAIIFVPVFVILIINGYISVLPVFGIVLLFISAIFLPLLAIAFGCLVGWLVALLSSRLRRKNVPTLILSLAFLVCYFWFYSRMMNNMNMLIVNGAEIAEAVRRAVFPAYHLGIAIADGSIKSFLIFAVFAVVPFAIMYALLSVSFIKLVTGGREAKKITYHEKTLRASGAQFALLKRELLHFWSQPMYIMNADLGAIAAIVGAVFLIVRPGLLLGLFDRNTGILAGAFDPGIIGPAVLAALAMVNSVSAPSISLEGKFLWIAKSLPVPARDILMSKVGLHLTVSGVPVFLAGIVCVAVIPMNAMQITLTLILPASVTLMFSMLGVTLNLAFPRFNWINPIQPVKQGISSMLSMFGGMALIAALALLYVFLLAGTVSIDIYLLICTVVFIAASAGLYAFLIGEGSRKFEAL